MFPGGCKDHDQHYGLPGKNVQNACEKLVFLLHILCTIYGKHPMTLRGIDTKKENIQISRNKSVHKNMSYRREKNIQIDRVRVRLYTSGQVEIK